MNKLVAIVGMCGSGKSVATTFFKDHGYEVIYFGGVTMKKLAEEGLEVTPENEKMMRERLRRDFGMGAYAHVLIDDIRSSLEKGNVVLDGVYSWSELKILKQEFPNIKFISIVVDKEKRYDRLNNREVRPFNYEQAVTRDISEIENLEKGGPICYADYFILNNNSEKEYMKNIEKVYNKMLEEE